MSYTAQELIDHLRYFWQKAEGLDYGQEHEVMKVAAAKIESDTAKIATLQSEVDVVARSHSDLARRLAEAGRKNESDAKVIGWLKEALVEAREYLEDMGDHPEPAETIAKISAALWAADEQTVGK